MSDPTKELIFQNEVIAEMVAGGWMRGNPDNYDRAALALYPEDVIGFVQDTQPDQWERFCTLYPGNPDRKFLERVAEQLNKADPNAADKAMRTFGTLGVLRHELRDRGTRFSLCQFKPEHDLNPDTRTRYGKNRLRLVPELVYSPWATETELAATGLKAKAWRIDIVLFVNGVPVATLELKSEFKQAAERAIKQYKTTRLPVDTHNMRSRSRYVRPAELPRIKSLLANFKRFRELVDRCVDLSVSIADRQTELLRADPQVEA